MIELNQVSIHYHSNNASIKNVKSYLCRNINLSISKGEFVSIMGPSGCGKSTLFAAIIGNLSDYFTFSGDIQINGKSIIHLPVEKRNIGMMFQEALLFPHLNVEQNLVFGMPQVLSKKEKLLKVNQWLHQAELSGINKAHIDTLSGGEAARISLLRTLLSEPKMILLDEPFAKLDAHLKQGFRRWVFDTIKSQHIPAILVTHNIEDAIEGKVLQFQDFQ